MDEKREGEIAVLLIRAYIREKGIPGIKDVKSDIIKIAKASGVSVEELVQFIDKILSDTLRQLL